MYGFNEHSSGVCLFHRYFYENDGRGSLARFNYHFENERFFSYNTVIGLQFTGNDGGAVLCYSFYSMSSTTAGHISALRRACPFADSHIIPVPFAYGDFYVKSAADVSRLFADYFREYNADKLRLAANRREVLALVDGARRFSQYVRRIPAAVMQRAEVLAGIAAETNDKKARAAMISGALTRKQAAEKAREEKKKAENRRKLAAFMKSFPALPYLEKVRACFDCCSEKYKALTAETRAAVRAELDRLGGCSFVWVEDSGLVTSQGVRMDRETAAALLKRYFSGRVSVGMHAGPYEVREIAADFVRVGCHKIPVENLSALVSALVLPAAPAEVSIL